MTSELSKLLIANRGEVAIRVARAAAELGLEGRAVGIVANHPEHLSGAITSHGADKASRFMQLCDAWVIDPKDTREWNLSGLRW